MHVNYNKIARKKLNLRVNKDKTKADLLTARNEISSLNLLA